MKLFVPNHNKRKLINNEPNKRLVNQNKINYINKCDLIIDTPYNPCDGYGGSAHDMSLAISKYINIKVFPYVKAHDAESHSETKFKTLIDPLAKSDKRLIYRQPIFSDLNFNNEKTFLFTMNESTKTPSSWTTALNHFKNIIVPCEFCKEVFQEVTKSKLHVVPLGVREDIFLYKERKINNSRPFRFLLMVSIHSLDDKRKNALMGIEAFIKVFKNNSNVELVIKTAGQIPQHMLYLPPNVKIISGRNTRQSLVELMHDVDCFVFPSVGEGFGLPPREAMSTGLPCILVNCSGLREISNQEINFSINPTGFQPAFYDQQLGNILNNGNPLFGEFSKINILDLCEMYQFCFLNQEKVIEKGKAAANFIRNNQTYDLTAKKIINIINI